MVGFIIEKLWLKHYQMLKIIIAGEPHQQPQYQTVTKYQSLRRLVLAEILKSEKTSFKRILCRNRPLFSFYSPFVAKMTAEFFSFFPKILVFLSI
jgi:hypothetical protein